MKKILILISAISLIFSQEYIAVIDFEGINVSEAEAKALSQNLTSEIIALDKYTVVERSAMKRIMDEQKFQHSGCVDTQCAVDIGKILGAKYIIVGSVGKVGKTFSIDARMIEVETGESYQSANYKHKGEIDDLLIEGMKSVAYQLAGLEYESKEITTIYKDDSNSIINFRLVSYHSGYTCPRSVEYYAKIYKIGSDGKEYFIGETDKVKNNFYPQWDKNLSVINEPNIKLLFKIYDAKPNDSFIGKVEIDNLESGVYDIYKKYTKSYSSLSCDSRSVRKGQSLLKGVINLEFF
jgi:TolB-like protein